MNEITTDEIVFDDDDSGREDVEACPGCGCLPGEGYTDDCPACMATVGLFGPAEIETEARP